MTRWRLFALSAALVAVLSGCRAFFPGGGPAFPQVSSPSPEPSVTVAPPLETDGDPIVAVVDRVRPAVVNVRSDFGGDQGGEGTGFIIGPDGVIVTNAHVVQGALRITIITSGGDRFAARPLGGDGLADLAVLKIDGQDLPSVDLGDSDRLKLGETVVALGFALGLEGGPSVTSGIVSATGRTIRARGGGGARYEDMIQTDAAINPGNSGGPLVDLSGRVVGINTAGVPAGQGENIGFAIAINRARPVIEHAVENPEEPVAFLGVSTSDVTPEVATARGLSVTEGAYVEEVVEGGPSEEAGVQVGDVIRSLAGQAVADSNDVLDRLLEHEPGEEVSVTVVRGDDSLQIDVTLGTRAFPLD
jgi:serine protease Do